MTQCNNFNFNNMTKLSVTSELLDKYVKEIIQGTACTLSHIQDVNDWNNKVPVPRMFVGKDVPDLPILDYCERLQKYFRCSPTVYLAALIYIDRFVNCSKVTINKLTIHRLLVVSFIIAVKYWEDLHYSNSYYAQVGGVDVKELNKLEVLMLSSLQYDLAISQTQFRQYFEELSIHPQLCPTCKGEPNAEVLMALHLKSEEQDCEKEVLGDQEMRDCDSKKDLSREHAQAHAQAQVACAGLWIGI